MGRVILIFVLNTCLAYALLAVGRLIEIDPSFPEVVLVSVIMIGVFVVNEALH